METLRPDVTSGRCGSGMVGFLSSVEWEVRNSDLQIIVIEKKRIDLTLFLFQVSPNKSSQIYPNHPRAECSAKVRGAPEVLLKEHGLWS